MRRFLLTLLAALMIIAFILYGGSWYVKYTTKDQICGTMGAESFSVSIEQSSVTSGGMDCILVLGAGLNANGGPGAMLRDRLDTAIYLYEQGYARTILLSGDNGSVEYDEVTAMLNYVLEAGVPASAVFCDYAGFSTYDSLYRAKYVFGAQRIIVVTQEYHLYRALYIGNALNLTVYGAAANQNYYLGQLMRNLREIVARDKDLIKSYLLPEATLLGDKIDIHGPSNSGR